MSWEALRRVFYSEFQAAVRRYDTVELLQYLGLRSSGMREFEGFSSDWQTLAPWTISGIAREAIISAPRNRGKSIDDKGFIRLANLFVQAEVSPAGEFEFYPFMVGKAHEQSSYQLSAKEDFTRFALLTLESPDHFDQVRSSEDWATGLRAPLHDVPYSTLVLYSLARHGRGTFHHSMVETLCRDHGHKVPPLASILGTLDRLTASIEEARVDALKPKQLSGGLQRYGYNPLTRTPFISLGNGFVCAPQTQFVLRSCSPENLFYLGTKQWGDNFSNELGQRIEAYTGQQLRHTGQLEVHPEITWGKDGKKSIDWFVVTPAATILVECKSAHTTIGARAGDPTTLEVIKSKIGPAYKQLNKSVGEMLAGNQKFAHIPRDKPLIGLVVTAEPTYLANTDDVRNNLPEAKIPIITLCLRELESITPLSAEVLGESLLKISRDPYLMTLDLHNSMKELRGGKHVELRNALVDDAYLKYVMPERLQLKLGDRIRR